MKNNLDYAVECVWNVCGTQTNMCESEKCKRIAIAKLAIDMILKGEYH